jgi:hypothetical protein
LLSADWDSPELAAAWPEGPRADSQHVVIAGRRVERRCLQRRAQSTEICAVIAPDRFGLALAQGADTPTYLCPRRHTNWKFSFGDLEVRTATSLISFGVTI